MIKAILVFNNHGKPRLTKFYYYYVSITVINLLDIRINDIISSSLLARRHATTNRSRNIPTCIKT